MSDGNENYEKDIAMALELLIEQIEELDSDITRFKRYLTKKVKELKN